MTKWLMRIGRAVAMGLAWGAAWVPVGVIGARLVVVGDLDPEHIGGPLYSGFLCGAMFSAVAGLASGHQRLVEMSLSQSGARGAVAGLMAGALFVLVVLASDPQQWSFYGTVVGGLTVLSAVSGVGSALAARFLKDDASAHVA